MATDPLTHPMPCKGCPPECKHPTTRHTLRSNKRLAEQMARARSSVEIATLYSSVGVEPGQNHIRFERLTPSIHRDYLSWTSKKHVRDPDEPVGWQSTCFPVRKTCGGSEMRYAASSSRGRSWRFRLPRPRCKNSCGQRLSWCRRQPSFANHTHRIIHKS